MWETTNHFGHPCAGHLKKIDAAVPLGVNKFSFGTLDVRLDHSICLIREET